MNRETKLSSKLGRGDVSTERQKRAPVSYEALGLAPVCVGDEAVAFLSMYLDESYGKWTPNVLVGGFVSSIDRWATFANRWKTEVQEKFKIPYLHMTEFMNEKNSTYRHLSWNDRVRVLFNAVQIIKEQTDFAVACSVNAEEYQKVTTGAERSFYGTAFTMAVVGCLQAIERELGEKASETTLSVYLEGGYRNANQAIEILQERWREQQGIELSTLPPDTEISRFLEKEDKPPEVQLGTIALGTKAQMRPLQAADLLSYGLLKFADTQMHPLVTAVTMEIQFHVPLLGGHISGENARQSLDNHLRATQEERASMNKIAQALGLVGGKVRRKEHGYFISMKNVDEEAYKRLVEALQSGIVLIPKRKKRNEET